MTLKLCVLLSIILFDFGISAQDRKSKKFAQSITVEDLNTHLSILASDSMEGRETGEKGQKLAALYIAEHFRKMGLSAPVPTENGKNSYFQKFQLEKGAWHQVYLRKPHDDNDRKVNLVDLLYYSSAETMGEEIIEVVYVENDKQNIRDLDLRNKYVLLNQPGWSGWQKDDNPFSEKGVAGFIVISDDSDQFKLALSRFSEYFSQSKVTFGFDNSGPKIIVTGDDIVGWIYDQNVSSLKLGEKAKAIFNADRLVEKFSSENVLGFLKGREKPDEVLVIAAHYDHIGIIDGEINNGADDDGSGTSAVLEIAEAFALASKKGNRPRRSILFMTVSGEEKGLLGSRYYTDHPIFPLANTVTNLNIDMIGRVDDKHVGKPNYIYLIGADKLSQELHDLAIEVNEETTKLDLDYTYNDENDPNRFYYRSDHYNFAKNDIPVIFYFNGTHADYHRPTDTIEKIHFEKMLNITKYVFYTAWEIANREDRVKLN
ncbi:MAG: M28 family peptidase [Cyclobacteriaceae bacterium]|nr:M28 family peptidase [Cyclobacteriaceae bacterium HetDA_MAG_MS6]